MRLDAAKGSWQFARFLATGALNAAFGWSVFALFVWLAVPPAVAVALATVLGVLFNYQTTRRFVFGGGGGLLRFAAVYLAMYGLNVGLLHLLMARGMSPYLGNALLLLPMAVLTYLALKLLVFEPPKESS